ncbi:MAG: phage antirepressor KilAC domain-containing protein [Bacteroides sp.]|nr:phage antirepressor KilAC domain-containing protein [Bacteroides sp.]
MYAIDDLIANPDLGIAALMALKEERMKVAKLETTVAVKEQQITEMKPKASYYDVILNCKDLLSTTEIAKDYGRSAQWLNDFLRDHEVQFKRNGVWLLYQKYAEKGYTQTKTHSHRAADGSAHSKVHTYWTQKGRLFLYDLLKSQGVLPTIEQAA